MTNILRAANKIDRNISDARQDFREARYYCIGARRRARKTAKRDAKRAARRIPFAADVESALDN